MQQRTSAGRQKIKVSVPARLPNIQWSIASISGTNVIVVPAWEPGALLVNGVPQVVSVEDGTLPVSCAYNGTSIALVYATARSPSGVFRWPVNDTAVRTQWGGFVSSWEQGGPVLDPQLPWTATRLNPYVVEVAVTGGTPRMLPPPPGLFRTEPNSFWAYSVNSDTSPFLLTWGVDISGETGLVYAGPLEESIDLAGARMAVTTEPIA